MRTALAIAALVGAVPAHAQIALEPGQAVTVQVSREGEASVTGSGLADLSAYDDTFLDKVRNAYKTHDTFVTGSADGAPQIARGALDVRFVVIDGKESVLVFENGYDEGIVYRATMYANGKSAPTDVCLVMPNRRGYEHWPFAIDKIELSGFRRVVWKEGDSIPCA